MNPDLKTIQDLFGSLVRKVEPDRCTAARKLTNPLPCQFAQIGKTVYCKIHNGLKV